MMLNTLVVMVTAFGGLVLLIYIFQSHMVFYPGTGREMISTPADIGLEYEDLNLMTSDGIDLHGWYIPARQSQGTVLFLHGNAGNISHRLESIRMFNLLGYSTLIIDYRGYGISSGTPTEQGTYIDAETAWHYLAEQRHVPSCQVVLFGESLGGAVAAWLAARKNPAALVISSGFTSVPDLAGQIYPFLPVRWLARIKYDTRAYLNAVTAPVFIAHSPEDEIIPFKLGVALYDAANPPKRFLELAGGHNEGFIFMRESWVTALGDFLAENLKGACNKRGKN